jgi:S1-C subfamily serine protease
MKFGLNIKSLGAAVLIMGLQPTVAHAQGLQGSTKLSSVNVDLVSSVLTKVKKSVVKVKSNDEFTCMGTVIESDGYILTKASELRGDKISCELPDGRVPTAKIVAKNEVFDLALLKIDVDDLIPVEWTLSNSAGLGSWVASVGPDKKAAAVGVVSVAARDIKLTDLDQVPAVRAAGGYMGILPAENPEGPGVLVQSYGNEKNGPAEKAGLKIDDVIVAINGKPVTKVLEFRKTVPNYTPNDVITLKVNAVPKN